MAGIVRCFICPPSPPKTSDVLRRFAAFPAKVAGETRTSEDLTLLPCKREKVAMFYSKTSMRIQVPSETDQILSSSYSISYLGIFQMVQLEETHKIGTKLSGFCRIIMEHISDHQRMMAITFLKTLAVANALMLILPFEVLAETCETDNYVFNMPLLFAIALIGATVGGLVARQRKAELKRLNDQLRQINAALRRQAKIESYAPNLSYAPVGRMPETEVIVDPRKQQLITNLRSGKIFLRNQDPEKAFVEFKAAFELAQSLGDHIEEKKAARGLGASLQRQGKYREAIKYHSKVLEIAKQAGEDSGSTEAYGAIADCYTELGDLERAGKFYDEYISRLESD